MAKALIGLVLGAALLGGCTVTASPDYYPTRTVYRPYPVYTPVYRPVYNPVRYCGYNRYGRYVCR